MLDNWFDQSAADQQQIRHHASECASCEKKLLQTEKILSVLASTEDEYQQLSYVGLPPDVLEEPVKTRWGVPLLPKLAWSAAAVLIVLTGFWYAHNLSTISGKNDSVKNYSNFHSPAIPLDIPNLASVRKSIDPARLRMPKYKGSGASTLNRQIKLPDKPKALRRSSSAEPSKQMTYRA